MSAAEPIRSGCAASSTPSSPLHDYADVDDDVVLARLEDPSSLSAFVAQVTAWLSAPR